MWQRAVWNCLFGFVFALSTTCGFGFERSTDLNHPLGKATCGTSDACTETTGCGAYLPRRKVLVIGVDGLRPSALERAMIQGLAPNLAELAQSGTYCWNSATSDLTFSGPGWTDLLAGVHRDQHLVETNSVSGNKFANSNQHAFPDLLALCKSLDPTLRTARWTTWSPLSITRTPGGDGLQFLS